MRAIGVVVMAIIHLIVMQIGMLKGMSWIRYSLYFYVSDKSNPSPVA